MSVHIKSLTLLIVGILVINIMSFGLPVFAVAAPGVGIPFPITADPSDFAAFKDAFERFLNEVFLGKDDRIYETTLPNGTYVRGTKNELKQALKDYYNSKDTPYNKVDVVKDDEGNVLFYTFPDAGESLPTMFVGDFCDMTKESFEEYGYSKGSFSLNSGIYTSTLSNSRVKFYKISFPDYIYGPQEFNPNQPFPSYTTFEDRPFNCSVFDELGFDYKMWDNIDDVFFEYKVPPSSSPSSRLYYTPFFIDKDLHLITSSSAFIFSFSSNRYSIYFCDYSFSITPGYDSGYLNFGFKLTSGNLFFVMACSDFSTFYSPGNYLYRQYIFGNSLFPTKPLLYDNYRSILNVPDSVSSRYYVQNFSTYADGRPLNFIFTDNYTQSDVTVFTPVFAGYLISNDLFPKSNLQLAASQIVDGDSIQGGSNTISNDLTDWQKAIYMIAQQQGTTFEEVLKKIQILIDQNGKLLLTDGTNEYNVQELAQSFVQLYGSVQNISGDLSKTLEYLKTLNLEGINDNIIKLEGLLGDLSDDSKDRSETLSGINSILTDVNFALGSLSGTVQGVKDAADSITSVVEAINQRQEDEQKFYENLPTGFYGDMTFPLFDQFKYIIENIFNYNDRNKPPNFSFYYDSDGDGTKETYPLIDLSILETSLTNVNSVDKSLWSTPIKVIDLIRYFIAIVIYGLFVMRFIKRLPTFYGNGPISFLS